MPPPPPTAAAAAAAQLYALAAQAGITLPGLEHSSPAINLGDQSLRIAEHLGSILSGSGVYLMADRVITIENGKAVAVSAQRFCTLVEEFVTTTKNGIPCTMGADQARVILESRQFTRRLPVIEGIIPVRVPVRDATGSLTLCPAGYDAHNRIFCLDAVDYPLDMPVGVAIGHLLDYFSEFKFAEHNANEWLPANRSFSVQLVALLNTYCRLLLPTGTPKPMFVWVANQQGSGKSVLAEAAVAPVYGDVATVSTPENKEEFSKLLDTTAQAFKPYLFIDDAPPFVASGALNRFVTSRRHAGRILGTPTEFDVPNVTTILLTGNNLELTADLMRRSLIVELFIPGEIEGRQFKRQIEPGYWSQPDHRATMLGVLWSLVRNWVDHDCPLGADIKPTFELWSRTLGGIIAAMPDMGQGSARPMLPAALPMSGDRRGSEWRELLIQIASEVEADDLLGKTYTTHDIVTAARRHNLVEDLCGTDGDKDLPAKELRRVGIELKRWRGRELTDKQNRRFQFGKREQARGSIYPLHFFT